MQFTYDGQIRRYLTQAVRLFSGFKWQSEDGKLRTVPVMYGDMTKQVASIITDNSENKMLDTPRMTVYIDNLELDRNRLSDPTFVSKIHLRERNIIDGAYTSQQGANYTVERIMPTPYTIGINVDIWTSNTNQKLQILEQLMVIFNPSLDIQTTDNYVDWTSLSTIELKDIRWSSRSIPIGTETNIDIATMKFESPIWISAPSKVKKLGIITDIIMNIFDESNNFLTEVITTIGDFNILVWEGSATLLESNTAVLTEDLTSNTDFSIAGNTVDWNVLLSQMPGKFKAGVSQIFLTMANGYEVVGTVSVNNTDPSKLNIVYDMDTFPTNTLLTSNHYPEPGNGYIDAIIDPQTIGPNNSILTPIPGTRYLLTKDILNGIVAWENNDHSSFQASANSIIEWSGTHWSIVLDPSTVAQVVYVTNLKTGIQYKWTENMWSTSIDGKYRKGSWKMRI